ncbi:MAG TPA: cobalamin-dependent protein, partial [Clostridia bacterium]
MKILLISINAKYIHSSLSVWYLKSSLSDDLGQAVVREFTINDSYDRVFSSIYLENPDILAFSCYIWNMGMVRSLVRDLRKVLPKSRIILGGPEASYDSQKIIMENPEVDCILSGEGEVSFNKLISNLVYGNPKLDEIPGLSYRIGKETTHNEPNPVIDTLHNIPSPYTDEMLQRLQNRIIYFESSRGCPYACSYCLSSITKGVRYLNLDETFKRLD